MSSDVLIRCDNVSKKLCRDLKRSLWYGVKDSAADVFKLGARPDGPVLRKSEFWANKDISFELKRGECFGLIGRNGSGKTTLLKMLNGLIKPDHGSIEIMGRVGALIALGAGFNPILTGRENVFVNGSILGLSRRQITDRLEEIVDFAELGDFIDSPVRTYSSGMNVRLGFAIAAILIRPDVLLLDEILAVGDASFRHRCYSRMNSLMSSSAVILVSHSMDFIAQCTNAVGLMERGDMTTFHDPLEGIVAYNQKNFESKRDQDDDRLEVVYPPVTYARVKILTPRVEYGGRFEVEVDIESEELLQDVCLSFTAVNVSQQPSMCWYTRRGSRTYDLRPGRQSFRFTIDPLLLHDGTYKCSFNAAQRSSIEHVVWHQRIGEFIVTSNYRPVGNIPYLPSVADCAVDYAAG